MARATWTTIGRDLSADGVRVVVRWQEMSDSGKKVAMTFASGCARRGLDLAVPFPVSPFNAEAHLEERLPDVGRENALAILVGYTQGFWPVFRAALVEDRARLEVAHPLDEYVTESVTDAARTGVRHEREGRSRPGGGESGTAGRQSAPVLSIATISERRVERHLARDP